MFKKNETVFYNGMQARGNPVSATVLVAHKDQTTTIKSRFSLDGQGEPIRGSFLGNKHRVSNTILFEKFDDLPK